MYETSDFRNNLKILYNNEPFVIIYFQHVKPGKGNAFTRTKLRSLISGNVLEITFKSGDKVGKPDIEDREMQYLYREADDFHFMDNANYEQVAIAQSAMPEVWDLLKENITVSVVMYNGKPLTVELPNFIEAKVIETDPGLKGDTASGGSKPAKIETGATIQVPLFIAEGDVIKVDTRTRSYLSRA